MAIAFGGVTDAFDWSPVLSSYSEPLPSPLEEARFFAFFPLPPTPNRAAPANTREAAATRGTRKSPKPVLAGDHAVRRPIRHGMARRRAGAPGFPLLDLSDYDRKHVARTWWPRCRASQSRRR